MGYSLLFPFYHISDDKLNVGVSMIMITLTIRSEFWSSVAIMVLKY